MIPTDDLVAALSANLTPVRRLAPPLVRATVFLLLAAVILAMLATARGLRPELFDRLTDVRFSLSLTGAILTGVLAAIAAFTVSLPGRSRYWLLLPLPALALWLLSIGYQCLTAWTALVPGSSRPGDTVACFATLVLTGLPLSLALCLMLRHCARFNATPTIFAASLSVAGLTAAALTLFHPLDASIEILMFNVATSLLIVIGGSIVTVQVRDRFPSTGLSPSK